MKLPKEIKLGCFTIKFKILDSTLSYDIAEQQGSYIEKTNTIYLSEDIFEDEEFGDVDTTDIPDEDSDDLSDTANKK